MVHLTSEQQAYNHLRHKLTFGSLTPGSRVSALAIAKEIGMSPTPVTQAIRKLEIEGLLDLVPHSGSFVKQPDMQEIRELYGLREALETYCIARAVVRLTPAHLAEMEQHCQVLLDVSKYCEQLGEKPVDSETLVRLAQADLKFHTIIVHAAGNQRIIKLLDDSHVLMRGMAMMVLRSGNEWVETLRDTYEEHTQMIAAIRRGDRKAAKKIMAVHTRSGIALMEAYFQEIDRPRAATTPASAYDVLQRAGRLDELTQAVRPLRKRRSNDRTE